MCFTIIMSYPLFNREVCIIRSDSFNISEKLEMSSHHPLFSFSVSMSIELSLYILLTPFLVLLACSLLVQYLFLTPVTLKAFQSLLPVTLPIKSDLPPLESLIIYLIEGPNHSAHGITIVELRVQIILNNNCVVQPVRELLQDHMVL